VYVVHAGEFELLSQPVGVPLVAFRLKPRTDEDGKDMLQQLLVLFWI
jgi:glutamate/tyrosine decarboxylase-like PLP-dependent enzyme